VVSSRSSNRTVTYVSLSMYCNRFGVLCVADPRQWSEIDVACWINWAMSEFSLAGFLHEQFHMKGSDICHMGKESFLARTSPFVGDILWEHLEILIKGKCTEVFSRSAANADRSCSKARHETRNLTSLNLTYVYLS